METTAAAASTLPDDGKRSRKPTSTAAGGVKSQQPSSRSGGARKPPAPIGIQPAKNVSALMLREMEELRSLAIGSPVPTPQPDDDDDYPFDGAMASGGEDGEPFYPAIRVDKCAATAGPSEPAGSSTSAPPAGSKCNGGGSGAAAHGNGASSKDCRCATDTKVSAQRIGNHK